MATGKGHPPSQLPGWLLHLQAAPPRSARRRGAGREKAKGSCSGVPHFNEFSWTPSSAYISFAGCTAAVWGTYFFNFPPRRRTNPKDPT